MEDGKNYFDEYPNLTPVEWLGISKDEILNRENIILPTNKKVSCLFHTYPTGHRHRHKIGVFLLKGGGNRCRFMWF